MKARLRLLAFILPELEDHTLFVLAEAVRLKTEDLTLSMEIRRFPGNCRMKQIKSILLYVDVEPDPAYTNGDNY